MILFSGNFTPFFRNITIFRQKKNGERCHLTKKTRFIIQQKRTKSTEQRQIIYNYLWFQDSVNIKNQRVSETFRKCSDIWYSLDRNNFRGTHFFFLAALFRGGVFILPGLQFGDNFQRIMLMLSKMLDLKQSGFKVYVF